MYWVDLVIIGIIALSIITGLVRGFVKELIALGIWILAFWLAYHYASTLEPLLQHYISDPTVRKISAFILLILGTVFAGSLVNALLSFILKQSGLSGTDRLLGMGFGFIRGVFLIALIMTVVKLTSLPYQDYSQHSKLYARFNPVVDWLDNLMPKVLGQIKMVEEKHTEKDSLNTLHQDVTHFARDEVST